MLSRYISDEELEAIRNDKEILRKAEEKYVKLVKRELAKIEEEQRKLQ